MKPTSTRVATSSFNSISDHKTSPPHTHTHSLSSSASSPITMTDRQYPATSRATGSSSILQKFSDHVPNSAQLVGLATLVISGGILLLLSGLTLTATVLGLIFFAPLILISSPVWIPAGFLFFVVVSGLLSFLGFGVAAVAAVSWIYRYFRGLHPPGSDRFDYARTRIADTAGHVKDYAIEYGGYLQSKVKDAAPSA